MSSDNVLDWLIMWFVKKTHLFDTVNVYGLANAPLFLPISSFINHISVRLKSRENVDVLKGEL